MRIRCRPDEEDAGTLARLRRHAGTGAVVWSFATNGNVTAAALDAGRVYFSSADVNVYALNASSGVKAWSFPLGVGLTAPPVVADGLVYVGAWDNKFYCLTDTL